MVKGLVMKKFRTLFVVLACALAIATATFFFHTSAKLSSSAQTASEHGFESAKPDTSKATNQTIVKKSDKSGMRGSNLPPVGIRLVLIKDELKTRAKDGDLPAAQRLVHDVTQCEWSNRVLGAAAAADPAKISVRRQSQIDRAHEASKICADLPAQTVKESLYPALLQAAQLGDSEAMGCYVVSPYNITGGDPTEPTDIHNANAIQLLQASFQSGDWKAVGLLQGIYSPSRTSSSALASLGEIDPVEAYKYLRLLRLGAIGEYADSLDRKLGQLENLSAVPAKQRSDADSWASAAFQQYFAKNSPVSAYPAACTNPYPY